MRTSTAENHINFIKNRLDQVFRCAVFDRPTSAELAHQMTDVVLGHSSYAILPNWAKDRIGNHRMNLMERIRLDYTVQLYVLENGDKVITSRAWDSFNEETRQMIRNGGKLPIKTFWLDVTVTCADDGTVTRVSRPTNSVYFES